MITAVWCINSFGVRAEPISTIKWQKSSSGTSGMISWIGLGVSSVMRLSTAIVFAAWNGGWPLNIT